MENSYYSIFDIVPEINSNSVTQLKSPAMSKDMTNLSGNIKSIQIGETVTFLDKIKNMPECSEDNNKYTVLVDVSMFMFKSLFGVLTYTDNIEHPEFNIRFARKFVKEVNMIFNAYDYDIEDVILAYDYGNWRKELQKDYKQNREEGRKESDIDFDLFFKFFGKFIADYAGAMPFRSIRIYGCEADDIIGQICIQNKDTNILLLSSDKDFKQLNEHNKNITQFNPQKWLIMTDKSFDVRIHAIIGDAVDMVHKLKKGVGYKTAQKLIASGKLDQWLDREGKRDLYELNLIMVDLTRIPEEFKVKIKHENETVKHTYNLMKFMSFCAKYKVRINKQLYKDLI